jgi:hypothetical protein
VLNERMSTQVQIFDSRLKSAVDPRIVLRIPDRVVTFPLPDAQTDTQGIQAGFYAVFNERLHGHFSLAGAMRDDEHEVIEINPDLHTVIGEIQTDQRSPREPGRYLHGQRFEVTAT